MQCMQQFPCVGNTHKQHLSVLLSILGEAPQYQKGFFAKCPHLAILMMNLRTNSDRPLTPPPRSFSKIHPFRRAEASLYSHSLCILRRASIGLSWTTMSCYATKTFCILRRGHLYSGILVLYFVFFFKCFFTNLLSSIHLYWE